MSEQAKVIRSLTGEVVSAKPDKTCVVLVVRQVKHPTGKYIKRSTKLHVHDEDNNCKQGDIVEIKSCRPMSKLKRWELVRVVEEARR